MKPPACPHAPRIDDCGTCRAELHRRAEEHARAVSMSAPFGNARAADMNLDRALAAEAGHRILHEHGIAPPIWDSERRCAFCGRYPYPDSKCCDNQRCPGRRVRCQLPAMALREGRS